MDDSQLSPVIRNASGSEVGRSTELTSYQEPEIPQPRLWPPNLFLSPTSSAIPPSVDTTKLCLPSLTKEMDHPRVPLQPEVFASSRTSTVLRNFSYLESSLPLNTPAQQSRETQCVSIAPNIASLRDSNSSNTFRGMVDAILHHPLFELARLGLYETFSDVGDASMANMQHTHSTLTNAKARYQSIEDQMRRYGVEASIRDLGLVDVCMAALIGAVNVCKAPGCSSASYTLEKIIQHLKGLARRSRSTFNYHGSPVTNSISLNCNPPASSSRVRFDPGVIGHLELWFNSHWDHPFPTRKERESIAKDCGLDLKQVDDWFSNHRKRLKQKQLAKDAVASGNNAGNPVTYGKGIKTGPELWTEIMRNVPPPPVSVSQVTSSGVRNIHLRSVLVASNSRRINLSDNLPPFSPNDDLTKNNTRFSSSNPPPPTAATSSPLRLPPAPLTPVSSLVAASNGSTSNGNSNRPSSASIAQLLNDPRGLSHHRNNNDNNGGMGTGNGHGMMQTGNGHGMMQNGSGNLANINGIHHGNNGPNNHRLLGIHTAFVPLSHGRPIAPLQFNGYVKSILDHPSLVFCGAYESSTGSALIISDIRAQNSLTEAAANCKQLETYAHKTGVSEACQASTSLDVFMCGMIAALNAPKNLRPPSIPTPLHNIIPTYGNQSHILSLTQNQGGVFGDRHDLYGDRRHSMKRGREASLNGRLGSAGNGNINNNNNDGITSTPTGASPSASPTTPSVAVMITTPGFGRIPLV